MTGYTNILIKREYPDLGENVYVEYRNPKTAAADTLSSDEMGNVSQKQINYSIIAKLLRHWHVYDATVDENAALLEGPADAAMVARMPGVIVRDILSDIAEALVGPR